MHENCHITILNILYKIASNFVDSHCHNKNFTKDMSIFVIPDITILSNYKNIEISRMSKCPEIASHRDIGCFCTPKEAILT